MNAQKSAITARIFELLDRKGLNNKFLERNLGKSSSTVSNWRTKLTPVDADLIVPISELLETSCEYLLTGAEPSSTMAEPAVAPYGATDPLDAELLEVFHGLTDAGKQRLIGRAEEMQRTYGRHRELKQAK